MDAVEAAIVHWQNLERSLRNASRHGVDVKRLLAEAVVPFVTTTRETIASIMNRLEEEEGEEEEEEPQNVANVRRRHRHPPSKKRDRPRPKQNVEGEGVGEEEEDREDVREEWNQSRIRAYNNQRRCRRRPS